MQPIKLLSFTKLHSDIRNLKLSMTIHETVILTCLNDFRYCSSIYMNNVLAAFQCNLYSKIPFVKIFTNNCQSFQE